MNWVSKGKINPLVGSAGIASVPIAARVSHVLAAKENPRNFLIMHAMGPNLAGVSAQPFRAELCWLCLESRDA